MTRLPSSRPQWRGSRNLPRESNPTSKTESPRSMQPVSPRTTEPDTQDRRARTTTDHSARTTTAPETRTSTANGPRRRWVREREQRRLTGTGQPQVRETGRSEILAPLTRFEMTSARTTETAHGNSWLLSCRWQEPAYPLCTQGLARVSCLPLRTPTAASPDSGSRESGRRRPRSILPVR